MGNCAQKILLVCLSGALLTAGTLCYGGGKGPKSARKILKKPKTATNLKVTGRLRTSGGKAGPLTESQLLRQKATTELKVSEKLTTQVQPFTPQLKAPTPLASAQVTPTTPTALQDTGLNLTGVQALNYYYPTWRDELGGMFSKEQLDAVEKAFAATDEWMFVRGEDGELKARNKDEWDYEARFLTILNNSGVSFTDKQIRKLVGGMGPQSFSFNQYFTLKNTMAFIMTTGKRPRKGIKENGQFLSQVELQKRAKEGDSHAAKLYQEVALGAKISISLRRWPQDSSVFKDLKTLTTNEQYLNQAQRKTPQEWLEIIEPWVLEHNRWPSQRIKEEKQLYRGTLRSMIESPDDPASIQMKKLKEKYKGLVEYKTPQEWLEIIEPWVLEHHRWPSSSIQEEKSMYQGCHRSMVAHPDDPASVRMKALREKYESLHASPKTPQEWLEIIEPWVLEHRRWPSQTIEAEASMYAGAGGVMRRYPNSPVAIRFQELQETYRIFAPHKTAEEYLTLAMQYSTKPRTSIYRDGHYLSKKEMTPEEIKEITIGKGLRTNKNHPRVKAYLDENRLINKQQSTEQLYATLVAHIHNYGHYPMKTENSLLSIIYNRLRYYQSSMVDGKYADPYLQKIYEIKQWSERVKRGEVDWEKFPGLFKKHRKTIGEMREQGILPQKEVAKELEQLPAEEQEAIEQMADNMLTLWEDFEGVWWQQNYKHVITTPQTQVAFNTVLKTVQTQVPGAGNVNISNVLEQVNGMQLGQDGPDYYKVIYRGNNPRLPRAEDFHNVWESTGIPQADAANAYKLNSPHIDLDGDEKLVYNLLVRPGITDKEMAAVIDALTPAGWEIRLGAHELLHEIKKGWIHIHIEQVVPTTEEDAQDISNVLRVDVRPLTQGKNPQQVAKTLRYLFAKYLKDDGHQALNNIQKAF